MVEDIDLLGKETAVTKQRAKNMECPEMKIEPVSTRWFVETIVN